jgi:hypothetical protein
MIIVDTPYHVTFDNHETKPILACVGKCRKVWWNEQLSLQGKSLRCPQCGSTNLDQAVEKVHYKILSIANRVLRFSDFEIISKTDPESWMQIKSFFEKNVVIDHISVVKPAFVDMAKKQWCS